MHAFLGCIKCQNDMILSLLFILLFLAEKIPEQYIIGLFLPKYKNEGDIPVKHEKDSEQENEKKNYSFFFYVLIGIRILDALMTFLGY